MSELLAAAACTPARLSDLGTLLQVLGQFLSLSLFSLGGGNTLLAEYHHLAVDQFCWLSSPISTR
jgi:chromate transporter